MAFIPTAARVPLDMGTPDDCQEGETTVGCGVSHGRCDHLLFWIN